MVGSAIRISLSDAADRGRRDAARLRFLPDPANASDRTTTSPRGGLLLAFTPTRPARARGWNTVATPARRCDARTGADRNRRVRGRQGTTSRISRDAHHRRPAVGEALNEDASRLLLPLFGAVALLLLVARSTSRACSWRGGCSVIASTRCVRRSARRGCGCPSGADRVAAIAMFGAAGGAALAVAASGVKRSPVRPYPAPRRRVGWPIFAFGRSGAVPRCAGLLPALRAPVARSVLERLAHQRGPANADCSRRSRRYRWLHRGVLAERRADSHASKLANVRPGTNRARARSDGDVGTPGILSVSHRRARTGRGLPAAQGRVRLGAAADGTMAVTRSWSAKLAMAPPPDNSACRFGRSRRTTST